MIWPVACVPSEPSPTDSGTRNWYDRDDDGFAYYDECDDDDSSVFPGAGDLAGDGFDQNCDGVDGVVAQLPVDTVCFVADPAEYDHFGAGLDLAGSLLLVGHDPYRPSTGTPHRTTRGSPTPSVAEVWDLAGTPELVRAWTEPYLDPELGWAGSDWFSGNGLRCAGGRDGDCSPEPFFEGDGALSTGDVDGDGMDDLVEGSVTTRIWYGPSFSGTDRSQVHTSERGTFGIVGGALAHGLLRLDGPVHGPYTVGWYPGPQARGVALTASVTWSLPALAEQRGDVWGPRVTGADLDADGGMEVVVNLSPDLFGLEEGEDAASPTFSWRAARETTSVTGHGVADLNDDGAADLVAVLAGPYGTIAVWFGPLSGELGPPDLAWRGTLGPRYGRALVVGDVDGDSDDDLVFGAAYAAVDGLAEAGQVCLLRGPLTP